MPRVAFSSLRVRLIILVFVALLPGLALILYTAAEQRRSATNGVLENALNVARAASNDHERLIQGARQLLNVLAKLPAVLNHDAQECSTLFTDIHTSYPTYTGLIAVKPDGDIFCSSVDVPGLVNVADRPHFQQTLKSRGFTVSEYLVGRISGKPIITFSYPAVDARGDVRAVVSIGMDLSWLNRFVAKTKLPPQAVLTVLDHKATVLARHPDPGTWVGKIAQDPLMTKVILDPQREGTAEAPDIDGVLRLFGYVAALEATQVPNVYFLVGMPRHVAFAEVQRILYRNLTGLGVVALLTLAAAWTGGNLFVLKQVRSLMEATRRLASGDLTARSGIPYSRGEIGLLAQAFDRMAEAVQMRRAERDRAEQALRKSEEHSRAVMESALEGIITADTNGRITAWNKAAAAIFGYPGEYILGQPLTILMPERYHEAHETGFKRLVATGTPRIIGKTVEMVGRRKDGSEIPIEISLTTWKTDDEVFFTAIIRDITERKKMEQALVEALKEQERIMETIPDIFYVLDRDSRLARWNKKLEAVTGFSSAELKGRHALSFFPEEEKTTIAEAIQKAYERGYNEAEGHLVGKDGTRVLYHWTGVPLRDERGPVLGLTGIGRDITERKRTEHEIRNLNDDLKRRAIELEAANRELEAFSYSVSHDLRAPLRGIDGFSQALLEDCADALDRQGKEHLERIRSASQRMALLIDDLLQLSRITRGDLRYETVDLSAMAETITSGFQKTQPERAVEFRIAPGAVVHGDSRLLMVALENLLENAWKFTGRRPRATIEFGVIPDDGKQVYFVRDDGTGFDMTHADKLFGPFQRLHREKEFPGTGIGLATVQRIIHRHGGRIWAEGSPGRGASFYFTL